MRESLGIAFIPALIIFFIGLLIYKVNTTVIIGAASIAFILYWLPKPILYKYLDNYGIVSRFNPRRKEVILTIDDMPHRKSFKKIIDILDKYNVKATFFLVPDFMNEVNEQTVINAIKNGHEFSNHGKTHTMTLFLSPDQLNEEIDYTDNYIRNLYQKAGKIPTALHFYRPPHVLFYRKIIDMVKNKRIKGKKIRIIMGGAYPGDAYIPFPSINLLYLKNKIEPGDIIGLHDRPWTVPLLDKLIPWLKDNDYKIKTLGEVF